MQRFLSLVLKILVCLVILLTGLRYLTKTAYGTSEINQANLNWFIEQTDTVDFLFIGNSYCYAGINNPFFDSLTGNKSFNLGYATAGPVLISNMFQRIDSAKIKHIVWITSPVDIINVTDNSDAYPYFLFNDFDDVDYYLKGYFDLRGLVSIYQKRVKYFFKRHQPKTSKVRGLKGEVSSYAVNPSADSISISSIVKNEKVNINKLRLFENLVQHNPKISLVIYPYSKFAEIFEPDVLKKYEDCISRLAKSGTQVINLNSAKDLMLSTDWRNFDHVNSNGARKITGVVAKYINGH